MGLFRPVAFAARWLPATVVVVLSCALSPVARAQGPQCAPEPTDMPITWGQSLSCSIGTVGDIDQFRFEAQAGELMRLQVVKQSGSSPVICVELFDPALATVHSGCGAAAITTMTLATSGTYLAIVSEQFNDRTVLYTIALERLRPPSPNARSLTYGATLQDAVEIQGDLDLFQFTGVAGDLIRVQSVKQSGSSPVICQELFDPDGVSIHAGCSTDATTTRTLTTTGTYVVAVTEQLHDRTVLYATSLACISGVCPPPPITPTYQISGLVQDLNDTPVPNIQVALSGSATQTAQTGPDGTYAFAGLAPGGTYTVTPTRPLFAFTPPTQTFAGLAQDQVAAPFVVTSGVFTRYFAEGATGSFFSTRIALLNATGKPTDAIVTFQKPDGTSVAVPVSMDGLASRTINPATLPGLGDTALATVIESTQPVIADRTMHWDGRGYGSHTETSIAAPRQQWYLAEGATTGFQLFYLIQNPGPVAADVEVTYLRPAPLTPLVKRYPVAGGSRFNIWVNVEQFDSPTGPQPLLASEEFSAAISSDVPVIVERAMYLTRHGRDFDAGHESAASPELSTTWFLAEGATGPYFDLFALIANPNQDAAAIEVTYLLPSSSFTKSYTVSGQSRFNIWADVDDPRLADTAVSMAIASTNGVPVLVERAMWWPGAFAEWTEGHNSRGAIETGEKWGLAAGEVGGPLGIETYVLVANTSAIDAAVRVTVVFEDGTTVDHTYAVPASSRFNVPVRDFFPETVGRRFGVVVESLPTTSGTAQIVVERASYNDAVIAGQSHRWAAGANAFGTKLR